jgi:hypothetical protein
MRYHCSDSLIMASGLISRSQTLFDKSAGGYPIYHGQKYLNVKFESCNKVSCPQVGRPYYFELKSW